MDWTQPVDIYCERMDPSFWAEPVNALTNLAFLLSAMIMWPRVRGLIWGRVLCVVLASIGLASGAFHTHAVGWTGLADVLAIVVYALIYIYLANRFFWNMRVGWAVVATAGFIPYAALTIPLFQYLPGLGESAQYMPLPVMILAYAWMLRRRFPDTARGLAIGAAILLVSLTFRSIDMPLCPAIPMGTHFMWHVLNAIMLGWMIEVWRRHVVRAESA